MFAPFVKVVCESFGSQYHSHCRKGLVKDFFLKNSRQFNYHKTYKQSLITEKAMHYNKNQGNLYLEHGHLSIQLLFCNVEQ